jgi:carbon monoxide dehydrogenase subunit G
MTKVSMTTELKVPADMVWKVIGGFNALPDWHPAVEKSEQQGEGVGATRKLRLVGGGTIIERLESVDDKEKVYSYSIVDSPLPVANYTATVRVRDDGSGKATVVEWSGEFKPAGVPEADAMKTIQGIYQAGLDNLRKMMGG